MITLLAFKPLDDRDVVSAWYATQPPAVRAALDAKMIYLRAQAREGWTRPTYDTLRDGVGEVRFKVRRINYRALGYFGPQRNHFCFLMFATKTDEFDPRNAIDIAAARRVSVENGSVTYVHIDRWG